MTGGRDDDAAVEPLLDPEAGAPVTADRAGYLQFVREDHLMTAARRHDVVLALAVRPGQYVLADTVTVRVHPPDRADERLVSAIRSALRVADARSPHQDPEFAIQQLTEMAVRALSPGTNDPYTAINALDDLSVGLARLAGREEPSVRRFDRDGVLRVLAPGIGAVELIRPVVDAMRWYAASSPSVMRATLVLVERVGAHTRSAELREHLVAHVDLLEDAYVAAGHQRHDVREFGVAAQAVRAGVAGR